MSEQFKCNMTQLNVLKQRVKESHFKSEIMKLLNYDSDDKNHELIMSILSLLKGCDAEKN